MSQFLLDLSISPRPWVSRVFRTLRNAALRVHDPYDVCVFHAGHADHADAFLTAERGFYAARSR